MAVRGHHFIQDELLIFGSSVEKLADEFGTQTLRPNAGELASAMKNAAGKVGCVFVMAVVSTRGVKFLIQKISSLSRVGNTVFQVHWPKAFKFESGPKMEIPFV